MEGSVELDNMSHINANRNGEVDGEEGDAESASSSLSAAEFEISDTSDDDEALDRNAQEQNLERIISNTNSVDAMKLFISDRIRGDHRLDLEPFIERLGTTASRESLLKRSINPRLSDQFKFLLQ